MKAETMVEATVWYPSGPLSPTGATAPDVVRVGAPGGVEKACRNARNQPGPREPHIAEPESPVPAMSYRRGSRWV